MAVTRGGWLACNWEYFACDQLHQSAGASRKGTKRKRTHAKSVNPETQSKKKTTEKTLEHF